MNIRDWLHVEDHCRAIELALLCGCPGETYNVGGGEELPNLVLIDMLCVAVDDAFASNPTLSTRFPYALAARGEQSASHKIFVPDRLGHDRRYAINNSKAQEKLGYKATHSFATGIRETLKW